MSVNKDTYKRTFYDKLISNLNKLIFISTCSNYGLIANNEKADENFPLNPLSHYAKSKAEKNKWTFDVLKGNINLLQNLVNGHWSDSEFLIINPGAVVQQSIDEDLVTVTNPKS